MAKRLSLTLCLLTGVIFSGMPVKAAITTSPASSNWQPIAQQGIAETFTQMAAEKPTSAQATLTLEDLPPGFTKLPPELAAEFASRLSVLSQQVRQGSLKPENFFAFANPENFQIVLGFTNKFPAQPEQASFDASLQQLQKPEVQQRLLSQLQEQLKNYGEIKVTEYRALPGLNNLADASTGITLALEMQGQPLRLDFAAFRRNKVGAFTAVMYPNGEQPAIAVGDVAQKLDNRIVQLSADANHSSLAQVR